MNGQGMPMVNPTTPLHGDCWHLFMQGPFLAPFEFTGWRDGTPGNSVGVRNIPRLVEG